MQLCMTSKIKAIGHKSVEKIQWQLCENPNINTVKTTCLKWNKNHVLNTYIKWKSHLIIKALTCKLIVKIDQ